MIGELLDAADDGSAEAITAAATAKLAQVEMDLRELATLRCRLTRLVRACSAGEHTCVTLQIEPDDGEADVADVADDRAGPGSCRNRGACCGGGLLRGTARR